MYSITTEFFHITHFNLNSNSFIFLQHCPCVPTGACKPSPPLLNANGGLDGADVSVLEYTRQYADTIGIGWASINALQCVTCAGTVQMT